MLPNLTPTEICSSASFSTDEDFYFFAGKAFLPKPESILGLLSIDVCMYVSMM